ncbi:MAG TPA: glutamate formimidoyltransferase [Methylomirabilota bacterium]|nr:glutamate formimidoyltransferase [Methylomirabilota bacterium]
MAATGPIVECVPNVSEGRDPARLRRLRTVLAAVPGLTVANIHADPDHHRSVFTFLGAPDAVVAGALALADAVVAEIDMRQHRGIHPRIGSLDVLPFVPLAGVTMAEAVTLAHDVGRTLAKRHALPVYYYAQAARRPERRSLRELRHGEYEGLPARLATAEGTPDDGPARFDERAGAVLVGARDVLVAYNVWLASADVAAARSIARVVRESGGGLPAVQALGLPLASRGRAQVSMNLLDYRATPIPAAFDRVKAEADRRGVAIERAELVGLAPRAAFAGRVPASVGLDPFRPDLYLDVWV